MPVDTAASLILENPEWGWALVLIAGGEQLFAPWETRTKKLIGRIEDRVADIEDGQRAHMTVTRALARTDDQIDTEAVDDYLVENGVEPDDFIADERQQDRHGGETSGAD